MSAAEAHRAIDAIWHIESSRLIAALARVTGDVGLAEDFAQDALLAALRTWPETGVPDKPGAWLMAAAKNRALDHLRRADRANRAHGEIGRDLEAEREKAVADLDAALDDDIGDDLLRLVFTACHPVLAREARVALTLRLLGGLTTAEIARAYFVPEATVAQRIVRAKKALADARVPFEVPRGEDRAARLSSVLEVLYLIFNEGYAATAGDDWIRPRLCEEALRLGRILASLAPAEPEVHGLVALMEIQASRTKARTGPRGEAVLLLDQDRGKWDHVLIGRGLAALAEAEKTAASGPPGPYALQAAIAACHARARTGAETDWTRIAALYDELARLAPSPVVELNRAVAVAMARGPAAGLEIVDGLTSEGALDGYHLLPSVRGDLLEKLGRRAEARVEFERAASLAQNARERDLLRRRAAANGGRGDVRMIVHLVDGTYELFRHFYGLRRFTKGADPPFGAAVGVLNTVLQMIETGATHVGVATDHVIESFRNGLWAGYKTGEGMERALVSQFHPLEDALAAMGVAVWPMVELEADDALASAARIASEDGKVEKVCIWTPDKDLGQCVRGTRVVQVDRKGGRIRDANGVREKFGVEPALIPDFLALVGDAADGYPGIPGIGRVGAARLLNRHGPIESFPPDVLGENRELALLFKDLATLRTDAPLFRRVDELRWRGPSKGFAAWAERLGDMRLLGRSGRAAAGSAPGPRVVS